jgi:hypothetical protein
MTGCNGHCSVTTDNVELHQAMQNYNRLFRITGTMDSYDNAELRQCGSYYRQCRATTAYEELKETMQS